MGIHDDIAFLREEVLRLRDLVDAQRKLGPALLLAIVWVWIGSLSLIAALVAWTL